jgi:hypothetical protein
MVFFKGIAARILVWLAAVLVPADSLSLLACDCGGRQPALPRSRTVASERAPGVRCAKCRGAAKVERRCRRELSAASSSGRGGACCGNRQGSCACCQGQGQGQGRAGTKPTSCLCAAGDSAPTPGPVPGDSRPDESKPSYSASSAATVASLATIERPSAPARFEGASLLGGPTALARLSALCRFVL